MFNKTFEINGIKIISFCDALADCIKADLTPRNSIKDVLKKLINEAAILHKQYDNDAINLDYMIDCIKLFFNRD